MKLICCLGNPGSEYHKTRHNIGFRIGDALVSALELSASGNKHQAKLFAGTYKREKIFLIQPQTYMNLSGKSLIGAAQFYKLPLSDCLVIYDDIDIAFGRLLMKPSGSAGTHNGMKSIVHESGGDTQFPRLRVGIGPKPAQGDLSDFVLGSFSANEESKIPEIQKHCVSAVSTWITGTLNLAMAQANSFSLATENQTDG